MSRAAGGKSAARLSPALAVNAIARDIVSAVNPAGFIIADRVAHCRRARL